MRIRTYLPKEINSKGKKFVRFLGSFLYGGKKDLVKRLKFLKVNYRIVYALERGLRGRLNIHMKSYRPTVWAYVPVDQLKLLGSR